VRPDVHDQHDLSQESAMSTPSTEDPDTEGTAVALDDLLARLGAPAERHPVLRTGERAPISWPVRLAVRIRDGNTCRLCGAWVRHADAELDHIVPWSAGGPDCTSNLRVLCRDCNQTRSNFRDALATARQPATWWCASCVGGTDCRTSLGYSEIPVLRTWLREALRSGVGLDAYDAIRELPEPVLAFCCRCDSSGYTRWVL
jgi:hypothetical protein